MLRKQAGWEAGRVRDPDVRRLLPAGHATGRTFVTLPGTVRARGCKWPPVNGQQMGG